MRVQNKNTHEHKVWVLFFVWQKEKEENGLFSFLLETQESFLL